MQYSKFAVDKKPFCVWEWDLRERNLEFINNLDPIYFNYLADIHRGSLENDGHKQNAALSLRTSYSHSLETFFSILFATIQAPDCIIGWLVKYQLQDLGNLVRKVQRGNFINSKLGIKPITWQTIAQKVLSFTSFADTTEQDNRIKEQFAAAWARFAYDFSDEEGAQEYNSIKHGFRIKTGGFHLGIAREDTLSVPAPLERMQLLGGSDFGSSFFTPERIDHPKKADKDTRHFKCHFRVRRNFRNWAPENSFFGLHLISISLQNILSFLKVFNGVNPKSIQIVWPSDEFLFEAPWSVLPGTTSMNLDTVITKGDINPFTKEEILSIYPMDDESNLRKGTS
jgi:hypothetical protein